VKHLSAWLKESQLELEAEARLPLLRLEAPQSRLEVDREPAARYVCVPRMLELASPPVSAPYFAQLSYRTRRSVEWVHARFRDRDLGVASMDGGRIAALLVACCGLTFVLPDDPDGRGGSRYPYRVRRGSRGSRNVASLGGSSTATAERHILEQRRLNLRCGRWRPARRWPASML
jgi:hypothetical protein